MTEPEILSLPNDLEDTTPQWVKDLQLEISAMSDEELLRFRVINDINAMQYQQDEPEIPPPEFWADVWWRTFELWCENRGLPKPHKADIYEGRKTLIELPDKRVLH